MMQVGGNQSQHSGHYHSTSRSSLSRNYEAVIGSLPRALSREERQAAQQSAPTASPALGALQQVPRVRGSSSSSALLQQAALALSARSTSCFMHPAEGQRMLAAGQSLTKLC
jgi:hypothetical protein